MTYFKYMSYNQRTGKKNPERKRNVGVNERAPA